MVYKNIEPFILGGVASCNAELFTFPIDLVKTRLQIQGQAINNCSGKYKGMFDCFIKIVREEGPKNLYSGLVLNKIKKKI
jgi:solute carrier family 25 protein 14/30